MWPLKCFDKLLNIYKENVWKSADERLFDMKEDLMFLFIAAY